MWWPWPLLRLLPASPRGTRPVRARGPPAEVAAEERALDVVAGESPGHLGQVVGAEGEELGGGGDLPGGQGGPGHFDHGADPDRGRAFDAGQDGFGFRAYRLELLNGSDERD